MAISMLFLFCFSPLLSLFFAIILYFVDKRKYCKIYYAIISFWFGIMSYYFIPLKTYDLVRHQNIVLKLLHLNLKQATLYLSTVDLEIIPKIYSMVISFTKNVNLLQFFVVSLGYFTLLYMLDDYRKKAKIKNIYFIPIVFYIISGFNVLYFFSGLYCYIAIIIFAFAFYIEYIKKCNKIIYIALYTLSIGIHNSMFFPLLLLALFKLSKEKINLKLITTGIIIFVFSSALLLFLNSHLNIVIVHKLYRIFYVYTTKNDSFTIFYSGKILYMEIIKLILTVFCTFICYKNYKSNNKIYSFIAFLSIMTSLMILKSRVAIRFIMLIQFIGIIPMIDYFSSSRKNKQIIYLAFICITTFFGIYFIHQLRTLNYGTFFIDKFYKSIFSIMK